MTELVKHHLNYTINILLKNIDYSYFFDTAVRDRLWAFHYMLLEICKTIIFKEKGVGIFKTSNLFNEECYLKVDADIENSLFAFYISENQNEFCEEHMTVDNLNEFINQVKLLNLDSEINNVLDSLYSHTYYAVRGSGFRVKFNEEGYLISRKYMNHLINWFFNQYLDLSQLNVLPQYEYTMLHIQAEFGNINSLQNYISTQTYE